MKLSDQIKKIKDVGIDIGSIINYKNCYTNSSNLELFSMLVDGFELYGDGVSVVGRRITDGTIDGNYTAISIDRVVKQR